MNKWIVGDEGGPAGPFYTVISQSGAVIALVPEKNIAEQFVEDHNQELEWEENDKKEMEAVINMTPEQRNEVLKEYGFDPVKLEYQSKALIRIIYENYQLREELAKLKPGALSGSCRHGYQDWNECPDCRH
jgi:hypothetical protein